MDMTNAKPANMDQATFDRQMAFIRDYEASLRLRTQWWWKRDIAVLKIEKADHGLYTEAEAAFANGKTLRLLGRKWRVVSAGESPDMDRSGSITLIEVVEAEANGE